MWRDILNVYFAPSIFEFKKDAQSDICQFKMTSAGIDFTLLEVLYKTEFLS